MEILVPVKLWRLKGKVILLSIFNNRNLGHYTVWDVDVFLTVHLSIILVVTNLMHKILFYNKFIICLYMFRALCAHHQEVKTVLYSIWYHHNCMWPSGAQVERRIFFSQPVHRTTTYRCDDTRCCIMQIWPPDDEHIVLETCSGI